MIAVTSPPDRQARVIRVEGPLRAPIRNRLRDEIGQVLEGGVREIVLDLAIVSAIDAAGVGELVHLRTVVTNANGTLRVVNPTARVRHILGRVGLLDLLTQDV